MMIKKQNRKSVKLNYLYNLTYQIFALITPLVTTPYVSRVLGSAGVGQYSFTYSIITYFTLFGAMGFGIYAQREIAKNQNDKHKQSVLFWEIFFARLISVLLVMIVHLVIIVTGVYGEIYGPLMLILTINIISVAIDVTFLFQGNEEFGLIALRNVIIKIIGVIVIFAFVKDQDDVGVYTWCQSLTLLFSNASLWTRIPRCLTKISIKEINVKKHIRPAFRLFVPTIAVSVYTMLDKTLIGILVPGTVEKETANGVVTYKISNLENGYYEQAEKLIKMASTVITSLGAVMIPRNSQVVASGNYSEFKTNVSATLNYVAFIGIPMMFGISAIAFNLSPWFFGSGYEKVPYLMMLFSPLIVIIGLTNVIGSQYLLPLGQDGKYTKAICIGSASNLILNLLLIRKFWSFGACIATIIGELLVMLFMFRYTEKDIRLSSWIFESKKQWIAGAVMFGVVFFTQSYLPASVLNTIILMLEGMLVYLFMLVVLRDQFLKTTYQSIKRKLKK